MMLKPYEPLFIQEEMIATSFPPSVMPEIPYAGDEDSEKARKKAKELVHKVEI